MVTLYSLGLMSNMRIGYGEDIHRLVSGRKLVLGGVHVPFELGEDAHSDGDVVYHALSDALLGSLALGDIGQHYPDTSKDTENMDSSLIVKGCYEMVKKQGYHVSNIDITVILEKPKIRGYIQEMRENIAKLLGISLDKVSIKAGTNEGLDAIGRSEAIKAIALVLIEE